MGRDGSGTHGTFRTRYEIKYLVSSAVAEVIRQFLRPFTVMDSFSRRSADRRYPICSLYFDSLDLNLYRQTVDGEKNRFKLRVRSYSDDPAAPVFLEVKRRVNDAILKRRARLPRNTAVAVLNGARLKASENGLSDLQDDLDFFTGHVSVSAARPFLRIRYMREAYEAIGGDPLRVTLDTDIASLPTSDAIFDLGGEGWIPTPVPGTVLEIKFTETYPIWVRELIRKFALQRQSVAKYVLSVDSFFAESGASARGPRRMQEPPSGWDGRPVWARSV